MKATRPKRHQPMLIIAAAKISDVSDGFAALTGHSRAALLGREIEEILDLLRVPLQAREKLVLDGSADCYLFTLALEPREVTISVLPEQEGARYTFEERPNSRLEDKMIFIEQVFSDNRIAAAIFSVPELILLKANACYLENAKAYFDNNIHPIGRSLRTLLPEYAGSEMEAQWNETLNTAQMKPSLAYETKNSQGRMTYWHALLTPIFENGGLKYIYCTHEDTTQSVLDKQQHSEHENALKLQEEALRRTLAAEQKKMLEVLQKSEVRLRSVLENSGDIIYSQNMQTNQYEYVSPASKAVIGYTPEEFMAIDAKTTHAMIHPEDLPAFLDALEVLDEKGKNELIYRQRTKNGDYHWYSNRLSVVKDEAGCVLYRFGNIHDITQWVEDHAFIRYQANLLQNISDMVISTDNNLNIISWNKAAERTLGWTEEEAVGQNARVLLKSVRTESTFEENFVQQLEQGKVEAELIQICKDGRKITVLSTFELLKNSGGDIIGTVGIFHDITERKKNKEALRAHELHLRLAADGVGLGTYSVNSVTGANFLSDELKALWGLKPDETARIDDDNLYIGLHPDDKPGFLDQIAASNDPNGNGMFDYDYRVIRPDGAIRWLHVRGQATFEGVGENRHPSITAGVVFDVTNRVEAEASIREITNELRNVMESTEDYIFSIDKDYRLIFFNSAFGNYIKENLGQQLQRGLLMPEILPMLDIAVFEDIFAQVAREGRIQIDLSVENERVLAFRLNPVFVDAQLVEITVFAKDITERMNGEREIMRLNSYLEKRVQERTEELEKSISALQNLSRLISHDLKEPIREIEAYAKQLCKDEAAKPYASKIKKTCKTMLEMVHDLTKYAMSSERPIQKQTINIKKMIATIYSELKPTITNRSILQFESGLPIVAADQVLLQQVVYNLLSNAIKFSSKKETSEITLGCVEDKSDYVFYIKDNGVGFDMQYAHKLFNIFERLHSKDEFEGTGIGLAAVRNIIQRHGGRTWIESKEQVGTVVYFTLPIAAEA